MPQQRFTTEEIMHKLREADVLSGQGAQRHRSLRLQAENSRQSIGRNDRRHTKHRL